jgi:hypothetical protein
MEFKQTEVYKSVCAKFFLLPNTLFAPSFSHYQPATNLFLLNLTRDHQSETLRDQIWQVFVLLTKDLWSLHCQDNNHAIIG